MEKLILLGTGHAMTLDCFNTCFVIDDPEGEATLVDTGGGLQVLRQLRDAGVQLERIHDVFISHQHTDHLLGLFWILRAMGRRVTDPAYGRPLTIYMHRELEAIARTAILAIMPPNQLKTLDDRILFRVVEENEEGILGGHPVIYYDTFSNTERQFGFRMILKNGQSLIFNGDVPLHRENYFRAEGVDWLLHDAFNLASEGGRANPGHSTVLSAAKTAEEVGAKHLVLYHGGDRDLPTRKERYLAEAAAVYHGIAYAPNDLDVIDLV